MDSKDKWIQDVEKSIDGIQQASGNPYLYHKILNRLQGQAAQYVKPRFVWLSLASFVLLIAINMLVFGLGHKAATPETDLKQLSNALNLLNENVINYN